MAKTYDYQPLLESGWIRLLHILPGARHDRLEGTLEQVRLTERETYETLSYTWGHEDAEDSVFVEGKRVAVTPNCSNAIRNLRRTDSARTFWIDAVCINQNDKDEKAQQVSMMGDIYARSQRTVVYLGAGDGSVHLVRNKIEIKPGSVAFLPNSKISETELKDARHRLLGRQWYHRKWIIQEVLLSRKVIVQAGTHEFEWAELETLDNQGLEIIKLAKKYLHPSSLSSMQINGHDWDPKAKAAWEEMFEQGEVIAMEHQRFTNQANLPRYSKYRTPQRGFLMPPQLFDVLCLTSNFACKEPRDRLFAVLSLFVRKVDLLLDYTCDEHAVYHSLTKELLSLGDTRMFWLDDRDSWQPRWHSTLSRLHDFVKLKGDTDTSSRPATDVGRLMKEVHQEKRVELISVPSDTSWRVQGIFLGSIKKLAARPFEHRNAAAGGPSAGPPAFSQPLWDEIVGSLALDDTTPHEIGMYPLVHVHERNRRNLDWFRTWTLDLLGKRSSESPRKSTNEAETKAMFRAMSHHHGRLRFCDAMKMFVCDSGLIGIAPQAIREDDAIYFLPGYTCPFVVLRPSGDRWQLVSLSWLGPLKLFPCCFNPGSMGFFQREKWTTLEII